MLPGDTILGAGVALQGMVPVVPRVGEARSGPSVSNSAVVAPSMPANSQPVWVPTSLPAVVSSAAGNPGLLAATGSTMVLRGDPLASDGLADPLGNLAAFSNPQPVLVIPDLNGPTVLLGSAPVVSGSSSPSLGASPVPGYVSPVSPEGLALPVGVGLANEGGSSELIGPAGLKALKTLAWSTYQKNPAHTGFTPATVNPAGLTLAWKAPTGFSVPLIVGQTVISMKNQQGIGNDTTSIRRFQLQSGAVNWDYTAQFVFPSQPTYSNNLVVFAAPTLSTPFSLYVLNASNGTLKYTVPLSNGFETSVMPTVVRNPATGDLMAYVATGSNLYAVKLGDTSGSIAWKQTNGEFGGFSMPTVVGNSIMVAGPGQFYAFDMTTGAMNHFHSGNIEGGGGTTVAYDAALGQFYVLEDYDGPTNTLTAYSYTDNADITQVWQKSGAGLRSGASVAIAPDDTLYSVDNTTILQINPTDGSTLRSLGGQSIANLVTPALSNGDLWVFSDNQTLVYDLNTFTLARTLPGSRGSLNSAYDSPGALTGRHFVLDYGNIYGSPGFDVYADQPPQS
jgi:hypothetical protein